MIFVSNRTLLTVSVSVLAERQGRYPNRGMTDNHNYGKFSAMLPPLSDHARAVRSSLNIVRLSPTLESLQYGAGRGACVPTVQVLSSRHRRCVPEITLWSYGPALLHRLY